VVVMTLGYGVPDFASRTASSFEDQDRIRRNYDRFRDALFNEVIPAVQRDYPVSPSSANRAIAGLSMGGAESLYIGLNHLDKFAYIGAFSSGGLFGEPADRFPNLTAASANSHLKQLWISCGTEDGLIGFNRGFVKWLKDKGVKVTPIETPGRHAWMVWRRDLISFTQLLFK
jgi:enterochelin esterase family protein